MKAQQSIGILLIVGAAAVLIPYLILTMIFDYPDILRQDPGVVLVRFHEGGSPLILVWLAFALLGLPLLIAYIRIGEALEGRLAFIRWMTTLGVLSGVVQIVGLLRWVFVVPVLAKTYAETDNPATREAVKVVFMAFHQFGGVLLGEHLGQLFTVLWMGMLSYAIWKLRLFPTWLSALGLAASAIYFLAQGELFATVIPGFPQWGLAGLVGSSLWLLWLIALGVRFLKGAGAGAQGAAPNAPAS